MGIAKRLKANRTSAGDVFSHVSWVLPLIPTSTTTCLMVLGFASPPTVLCIMLCCSRSMPLRGDFSPGGQRVLMESSHLLPGGSLGDLNTVRRKECSPLTDHYSQTSTTLSRFSLSLEVLDFLWGCDHIACLYLPCHLRIPSCHIY